MHRFEKIRDQRKIIFIVYMSLNIATAIQGKLYKTLSNIFSFLSIAIDLNMIIELLLINKWVTMHLN